MRLKLLVNNTITKICTWTQFVNITSKAFYGLSVLLTDEEIQHKMEGVTEVFFVENNKKRHPER